MARIAAVADVSTRSPPSGPTRRPAQRTRGPDILAGSGPSSIPLVVEIFTGTLSRRSRPASRCAWPTAGAGIVVSVPRRTARPPGSSACMEGRLTGRDRPRRPMPRASGSSAGIPPLRPRRPDPGGRGLKKRPRAADQSRDAMDRVAVEAQGGRSFEELHPCPSLTPLNSPSRPPCAARCCASRC